MAKKPPAETVLPKCEVKMVMEKKGTKKDGTPWTAYFVLLNDGFSDLEVGTFSKTLAGIASTLSESNQPAEVTFKSGKIEGKFELVNILPASQPHAPKQKPPQITEQEDDNVLFNFDAEGKPIPEGNTP